MNRPGISVAMCTYNGSRFVAEQLRSIASQTLAPAELIVCDDASTDNTPEIVKKFSAEAPFRVRVFSNDKTLGVTKNFEKAIQICEGNVIALSDQDDIWKPHKLERLSTVLDENPGSGYAFSDAEMINDNGTSLGYTLWEAHSLQNGAIKKFDKPGQLAILLRGNVVSGAGMAFRASLKSIVLPISSRWLHDYWIALLGSTIAYGIPISECLFQYRSHSSQQVGMRHLKKTLLEICGISLATTMEDYWKKLENFQELRNRVQSATVCDPFAPEKLELLRQKESHLSKRAAIHSGRGISRMRMLLSEALTGRYKRFSDSWRSVGRDLLPGSILSNQDPRGGHR